MVPQRISSHLETIVSRAMQSQDGRIPCPVDRNLEFFLTSHTDFLFIFEQCGDNCKLKSVPENKSRGQRMSKIDKSKQSYSNGHLPYHCSFFISTWRAHSMHDVAREFARAAMHSKDAQKQLAQTSISYHLKKKIICI